MLIVSASSGFKLGLPVVSIRLNAPVAATYCNELDELDPTVWFRVGPRNVEPNEARRPILSVTCHLTETFGSVVEPVSPP